MRLIDISDSNGMIRIEFFGCNMKCPYCVHIHQPFKEVSVEEVVDLAKNSLSKAVHLGGAEPTLQKELIPLIKALNEVGKEVLLKSNGMKPGVLEDALPYVHGFVLELKAPLDNLKAIMELTCMSEEKTKKYVGLLSESLEIAHKKWLRIWVRVIPGYVDPGTLSSLFPYMEGASEVLFYQFLSNPDFDLPFREFESAVPSWDDLENIGKKTLLVVPRVILMGVNGKLVLEK
ncbi:radical SAM protein [Methanococcoides burtonii]|uniref:Fe-S protein, radical SAM family n=1 Tax=Methanococcoides burtonii (strain DSM 6242 / NBRC 107633 / OCM 468 / ACE-M) TaxID=259564 RepID=Q12WJ0_METBU|nr:radical SAM protein [Methanococcoides burtonii]ABE52186.1 Fe-S protein, radical SAM family [Methanococcoides burtonii DSM 6242]